MNRRTRVSLLLAAALGGAVVATYSPASASPAPLPQPRGPVRVAAFSDGCDRGYGDNGECIPVTGPNGTAVTCTYLRTRGYLVHPVKVKNDDKHLARNGVLCG